ncbi:CU044_5270 family protein, partial [Dactylosporangium sp. NPDC049525]|uniref:CU044_5270 family protein n=1 Tax=Dactylosporangium sp. NPDC049525 TaxID=3154730 RepID=UPI00344923C0
AAEPRADQRRRVLTPAGGAATGLRRSQGVPPAAGGIGALLAGAVAAAVIGAAVISGGGSSPSRPPTVEAAPGTPPSRDPVQLLRLAGQQVIHATQPAVRPDQFVYTETVVVRLEIHPDARTVTGEPRLVRQWLSVDGTRPGLTRERPLDRPDAGWRDDRIPACPACPGTLRGGLPTDAGAMAAYLYRPPGDDEGWHLETSDADTRALDRATVVLTVAQTAPAVQAALFAAMERIPGVRVRDGAADLAGRTGVALVWRTGTGDLELIFDPQTFRYQGMNRTLTVRPQPANATVQVPVREALQHVAVVDNSGDTA